MTDALEICGCGHLRAEHSPGRGCMHVNTSSRHFAATSKCACARYAPCVELGNSEVFLAKQLNHAVRKEGLMLEQVDRDELAQVMRISLWRATTKYDSRSHIRFGSYASFEVYNDAIDELRSRRMFGRRGEYRLQPLPAPPDADDTWIIDPADPLDDDATGASRLDRVIAELTVDPPDAGDIDCRWAFTDGDREALGALRVGRRGTAEVAQGRAREPAWREGLSALISTRGAAA